MKFDLIRMKQLLCILLFCIINRIEAQTPKSIWMEEAPEPSSSLRVKCNDAGTVTLQVGPGTQSNDIKFLCKGDSLFINHDGNFDISGDPLPGTAGGVGYGFYKCPPTVQGDKLSDILKDTCIIKNPIPTGGIWVATGPTPNGDVWFHNDCNIQEFFNDGKPVSVWFAPITIDNFAQIKYESVGGGGAGPCVNVNTNEAFQVVYLNPIRVTILSTTDIGGGMYSAQLKLEGGLSEYDGSTYPNVSIIEKSNGSLVGTITSGVAKHGNIITVKLPAKGSYNVLIEDGKSCDGKVLLPVPSVVFSTTCKTACVGEQFCIDFTAKGLTDFESIQLSIIPNLKSLTFVNVVPGVLNGNEFGFNYATDPNYQDSILIISWYTFGKDTVLPTEVLFSVCFTAKNNPNSSNVFQIIDDQVNSIESKVFFNIDTQYTATLNSCPILIESCLGLQPIFTQDSTSCYGRCDGEFTIQVQNGKEPYQYKWQKIGMPGQMGMGNLANGGSIATINNRCAGFYQVTVNDSSQPPASEIKTVEVLSRPKPIFTFDAFPPKCYGDNDGTIQLTVQNMAGNLDFDWKGSPNGDGSFEITDLTAGQYQVTVTDNDGCQDTSKFTLTQPDSIFTSSIAINGETCLGGGANGSITVSSVGGTTSSAGYNYSWTGPNGYTGSGKTITGLVAGKYIVTAKDDNNCQNSNSFIVPSAGAPVVDSIKIKDESCPGAKDGSIQVYATPAGSPIISYIWTGPSGYTGSGNSITGLEKGLYDVTITAQDGCAQIAQGIVNGPLDITISPNPNSPGCPGDSNGDIFLTITGGTPPYKFKWSNTPSSMMQNLINVSAGVYTVSVTDNNNCPPKVLDITLEDAPSIEVDFSLLTKTSCAAGVCDGGATATAKYSNGAAGTFKFEWSTGEVDLFKNSSSSLKLCEGENYVTVSDNLCSKVDTVIIEGPGNFLINIDTIIPVSCHGLQDGSIFVGISGGTGPYTYTWFPAGSNQPVNTNLKGGNYSVTIEDGKGCLISKDDIIVPEPEPIHITIDSFQNERCQGSKDGFILTQVTGGNSGQNTYIWTPGISTGPNAQNLGPGLYTVTVIDIKGCQHDTFAVLNSPPLLQYTLDPIAPPPCFGQSTEVQVSAAIGGNGGPYTYTVDNGFSYDVGTPALVFSGDHLITIQDSKGCSNDTLITIVDPQKLFVDLGPDITVELGFDIQLTPTINSFLPIDSVKWIPSTGLDCDNCISPNATITNLTKYQIGVWDINGCYGEDDIIVDVAKSRRIFIPNVFSPNFDGFNDYFSVYTGPGVQKIDFIKIFDRWGEMIYEQSNIPIDLSTTGWNGNFEGRPLNPGIYVYMVQVTFIDGASRLYRGDLLLVR